MPGEISAEDIRVCGATPTPRATASWMTSSLPPSSVSDKNYIPKESLVVKPKDDTNTGIFGLVVNSRTTLQSYYKRSYPFRTRIRMREYVPIWT